MSDNTFEQHALSELIENRKNADLIKAKLVFNNFEDYSRPIQQRLIEEMAAADTEFSLPLLLHVASRYNWVLSEFPGTQKSISTAFISNPSLAEKTVKASGLEPESFWRIIEAFDEPENGRLISALLSTCVDVKWVSSGLKSLERLNQPETASAVIKLVDHDHLNVSAMAIRTLKRLASDTAIAKLNQLLCAPNAAIRNLAKDSMKEIGADAEPFLIANLGSQNVDLLIHTLNLLQAVGGSSSIKAIRQLVLNQPDDANVRFAAYEALANLPTRKGDYILSTGLTDVDASIRLAAAKAIDAHLDESLTNGVVNMLNADDSESEKTARAIIDAQPAGLFKAVLTSEIFQGYFLDYFSKPGDKDTIEFYTTQLKGVKIPELLDKFTQKTGANIQTELQKIAAVDDSKLILKIYQSAISELGFEPVLFEYPGEFLTWVENEKPLAVFTDLNMPGINGIELIKNTRQLYKKEELPIIMATTQEEAADVHDAYSAGVNEYIKKPFDSEKLRSSLEKSGVTVS